MQDPLDSIIFHAADGSSVFSESTADELVGWAAKLPRPLVFTNGCFDILHRGHISYLAEAAGFGSSLLVAVNDDASVRAQNKGDDRPVNPLADRLALLAALRAVDAVVGFSEQTPLALIELLRPDVLVKGGDWAVDQIVGADEIHGWGGSVHSIPFRFQRSTTDLLKKIRSGQDR